MERLSKAGIIGLALSCFTGHALAQNVCVRAQDLAALQIAAVQQELMVAALTCDDVSLYNGFVVAYRKDLKASDDALQAFFRRRDATTGTSDYHTFKTKMANAYSVRSAGNKGAYCKNAQDIFHAALGGKQSLSAFALAQPISVDKSYATCGDSVEGGATVAGASVAGASAKLPGPVAKVAAAKLPERDALASAETAPLIAAAPLIAPASIPPAADTYRSTPEIRDPYSPDMSYAQDDRAEQDATAQLNRNQNLYGPQNGGTFRASDRPRVRPIPSFQPPPPPYGPVRPYDPYARGLYGRAGGGYYDRYYGGYPSYRDSYGRYWYGVPPQIYLGRR